jgi:NTP pyrophosphatase (non-canonical NTP hydrolase)
MNLKYFKSTKKSNNLFYTSGMAQQSFEDAINEIKKSINRYQKIEGKPWGVEGAVIELAKQAGQLSALVMNREGYYFPDREKLSDEYDSTNGNIADELADIMFAVVRIAGHYGIDLVATNVKTRKMEDAFLKTKGV